jgi:hypothetical protein
MPIRERLVEIFDARGSPGGDSLPFYADRHAPNGTQLMSEKSTSANPIQKTLRNETKLTMVDPEQVPSVQEKASGTPLWECVDGRAFFNKNGYCQVWLYGPEHPNGTHGYPVVPGFEAWCKMSHLHPTVVDEPTPEPGTEPEPEPTEPPDISMSLRLKGIRFEPDGIYLDFE